jgi:hypothetical protein
MIMISIDYSRYKAQEANFNFWDELYDNKRVGQNEIQTRGAKKNLQTNRKLSAKDVKKELKKEGLGKPFNQKIYLFLLMR